MQPYRGLLILLDCILYSEKFSRDGYLDDRCTRLQRHVRRPLVYKISMGFLLGCYNYDIGRLWGHRPLKCIWKCLHNHHNVYQLHSICIQYKQRLVYHLECGGGVNKVSAPSERNQQIHERQKYKSETPVKNRSIPWIPLGQTLPREGIGRECDKFTGPILKRTINFWSKWVFFSIYSLDAIIFEEVFDRSLLHNRGDKVFPWWDNILLEIGRGWRSI